MSGTRCEVWNWLLAPSLLGLVVSFASKSGVVETSVIYSLWIVLTLAHIHYGTCVVSIYTLLDFLLYVLIFFNNFKSTFFLAFFCEVLNLYNVDTNKIHKM